MRLDFMVSQLSVKNVLQAGVFSASPSVRQCQKTSEEIIQSACEYLSAGTGFYFLRANKVISAVSNLELLQQRWMEQVCERVILAYIPVLKCHRDEIIPI